MSDAPAPPLQAQIEAAARLLNDGDGPGAEQLARAVLDAVPEQPWALDILGLAARAAGRLEEAVALFARAAAAAPDAARVLVNQGATLLALGRPAEALGPLERACGLAPRLPAAWLNAGRALERTGRRAAAHAAYGNAAALAPDDAEALTAWGRLEAALGAPAKALPALGRAVEIAPTDIAATLALGEALARLGRSEQAATCFERVLALSPGHEAALLRRAQELRNAGRLDEAEAAFRAAADANPALAGAWGGLGVTLGALRRHRESEAAFRRALALAPDQPALQSDMLVGINYRDDLTPAQIVAEHRAWAARHAAPLPAHPPLPDRDRSPDRCLRVGLVSPDLGQHPVGFLTIRLVEAIDRNAATIACYATRPRDGALAERFKRAAAHWVAADRLDDEAFAARIRADRIDILIDMAGHFADGRLAMMARRPAPVQASWAGWVATTGMAAIDWVIGDPLHVPPEAEPFYDERVVRLPRLYVVYDPPSYAPAVAPLPAATRGHVTFAAFHNPSKMNDGCVALWARVLAAVPGSRIVFKYGGIDAPATRAAIGAIFAAHGVAAGRLDFDPPGPHAALLARYNDCDVALDATPYCGATTTCEALWMGVPVVSLAPAGPLIFQRHGVAYLTTAGLPELIARDADDYVAKAVALAQGPARLAALRAGLRARVAASPLCDGAGFARDFAAALRTMWHDWVART